MNNFNKIIDQNIEDDSNESGSDNEGNQSEDNNKEGNADTEDDEEDCEEVKLTNIEQIRSMNKSNNEKYIKDMEIKNNEEVKMSSYELLRATNIARNEQYMKELFGGNEKDSLMMKEKVKKKKTTSAKKVKFRDDTKVVRRKSARIKEKSVASPKKIVEKIKSQETISAAIDSPLQIKIKANEESSTVEFDMTTVHTFNKFVAEINDEENKTKLMQLTNEERVMELKRFCSFIKDSNAKHYQNLTFNEIDQIFFLICEFTIKDLIDYIKELVKCSVGGEFPKFLVLYYLCMFMKLKTFANYLRSVCFKKKMYI
jgi:hypothetical protein